MYLFFSKEIFESEGCARITGGDVNHIRNVLRMKEGEKVRVSDGASCCYTAEIADFGDEGQEVNLRLLSREEGGTELPARVHLFQCLPKQEKMEWVIQKNTELGVAEIIPVASRRCVVKLDAKKAATKVTRWNAIAESAAKQSKRLVIPEVKPVMSFAEALRYASAFPHRAIPYENAEGMKATRSFLEGLGSGEDIAVFIGPEGGFEPEEVEAAIAAGFEPLTLGKRILRTETAGMTFLALAAFFLEEREERIQ